MFLRLCVVGLFGVQGSVALAQSGPTECKITSPAMKLISTCSQFGPQLANPKFYGSLMAGDRNERGEQVAAAKSTNGVNHCFNALIGFDRNGDKITARVLRDVGLNPSETVYDISASGIKRNSRGVIALEKTPGYCFASGETLDKSCFKTFAFGTRDSLAATLKLDVDAPNGITHSITAAPGDILQASRSSQQVSAIKQNEVNLDAAKTTAIKYARAKLLARVNQPQSPSRPGDQWSSAIADCDKMLIEMENSMPDGKKVPSEPEEVVALNTLRARLKAALPYGGNQGGAESGGGAGGGASSTGGGESGSTR